jgi:protocatechuate 3,4-dioxygenase beta subunit
MKAKNIFLGLFGGLALLQFFPIDKTLPPTEVAQEFHIVQNPPDAVFSLIKKACYDCHSNHTRYPWYANVQPVGWWLQSHVKDGRANFNFSEFGKWEKSEQLEVLGDCAKLIEKGKMPLGNYLPMHPEARLTAAQKTLLISWLRDPTSAISLSKFAKLQTPSDTCDDNEKVRCCFVGMPDSLTSEIKIAEKNEPGERFFLRGRVFKADGKTPYAGVVIYSYHTDATGIYPKKGDETGIRRWHGRLHGWCRSDAEGWFSIHTIRPASYPNSRNAAHIHHVIQEPDGSEPYYINDTVFEGDPFVDDTYRANEKRGGGSSGIVKLGKDAQGVWEGKRFITLKK